ncbi:MAG: saccharopine dehydrogenase NADP-binding domain-containing protein [Myxococcales bacterium]|nr:saccharopine dehydrogenase NADP-binding domain-containing protein [Myxococcales bacterium]
MSARPYDVIIYGATGFTGRQCALDFAEHAGALRWAIAGRSRAKLEALAAEVTPTGIVVADSQDAASVAAMAAQARVVLSTAGPYAKYGDPVVDACVAHGAHYCDITGETAWVRRVIDRHHAQAAAGGVRLVPFCGFDSVPADLGTLALVTHLRATHGTGTRAVRANYTIKGGLNGGTLDSALTMAATGDDRAMADAFLLNPADARPKYDKARHGDRRSVDRDPVWGTWRLPFVMQAINTRVVRRSAALADEPGYGADFSYQEAMESKGRLGAYGTTAGLAAVDALLRRRWGRALLARLGPAPGEGPAQANLDGGFTRVRYVAEGEDGTQVKAVLQYPGDAGNRFTVLCLCEAARLLAATDPQAPGGVLTPATAFGLTLLDRMQARGVRWTVTDPA